MCKNIHVRFVSICQPYQAKKKVTSLTLFYVCEADLMLCVYKNTNISGNTRHRDSIFECKIDKTYGDIMAK